MVAVYPKPGLDPSICVSDPAGNGGTCGLAFAGRAGEHGEASSLSRDDSIAAAGSLPVGAQQRESYLIVFLLPTRPTPFSAERVEEFRQGLRDLGRADADFAITERYADLHLERLPALAEEAVSLRPAVIVTGGTAAARAAKDATHTIPIVMAVAGDPVAAGLVQSLARPGGNLTGNSLDQLEIIGKQLQLLKTVAPAARRIAILVPSAAEGPYLQTFRQAAEQLHIEVMPVVARLDEDLVPAFESMTTQHADAVYVLLDQLSLAQAGHIAMLAADAGLPAIYGEKANVRAGGLMSYGPDSKDLFRRAATYVDKILKGRQPGDLPIEQPTKFELTVNVKTAKALGLTVPRSLLQLADEVIE